MQAEATAITLEEYYERGREAVASIDKGRWTIGDDALKIEAVYRGHDLESYAKQINIRTDRVREYRRVCEYYEYVARATFLEGNPMISYSHMRDAMRFKDVNQSYQFLEMASDLGLTVEAAGIEIVKALGKPVPPVKVVFEATPEPYAGIQRVQVVDGVEFGELIAAHPDARVTVTVSYSAETGGDAT